MTSPTGNRVAFRVEIDGRVQGVGFRYWMRHEAHSRGISGWVRNRFDGTVEALFAGSADAVQSMIEACRKGPPAAHVVHVRTFAAEVPAGEGFDFLPSV